MSNYSSVGYLAIDAGTHAVRAALFFDGAMEQIFSEAINLDKTPEGFIEQNPEAMAAALKRVCQRAIASAKGRSLIAALAVQRSSVLLWDKRTAKPLSRVLSWQDTRGQQQLASFDAVTRRRILALTGLPPSAHYGATKLAWLQQNIAASAPQMTVMGPLACWLASQLTGAREHYVCDHVNAARTQLLNRQALLWDAELCELFGIDAVHLPEPAASEAEYGVIAVDGEASIPLVAVLGDQNAAYIALRYGAAAARFNSPLVVNMGSGAFVLGELPAGAITDDASLLTSLAFSRNNQRVWLREGTVNAAGATITRWLAQLGSLNEDTLFQQLPQWLDDDAHAGVLCIDTDVGLGSPFWRSYKVSQGVVFLDPQGQMCTPTIAAQAVAVIESIVFLIAANLQQIQASAAYDGLIVAGGLARVTGLVERLAQLSQLPYCVANCHEATLQGAAVMASGFRLNHANSLGNQGSDATLPKPVNAALTARFERYIQCLQSLV